MTSRKSDIEVQSECEPAGQIELRGISDSGWKRGLAAIAASGTKTLSSTTSPLAARTKSGL